jgi:phosphoribosylaminoimidazole-succinocarboxamide synthase
MDKDRFRKDLGGVTEAYREVAKRLGILKDNGSNGATGPVLVSDNEK